jgi:hypothetical protein
VKQAVQPGFYAADDGTEVEIRSGMVRADNHRDVLRCPTIFRDISIEDVPAAAPKTKAAPAPVPEPDPAEAEAEAAGKAAAVAKAFQG